MKTLAQEGAVNQLYPSDPSGNKGFFNSGSTVQFNNMAGVACDAGHGTTKGCTSSFSDGLQQTVTGLVAGHTYAISFWTSGLRVMDGAVTQTFTGYAGTPMGWDVSFAGVTQQGVRAPTFKKTSAADNGTPGPWLQTTLNFVADGSSDVLAFMAQIPPQGNPEWSIVALADVRISDVTAVPEPSMITLMLAGIVGLLFLRRPQRSRG